MEKLVVGAGTDLFMTLGSRSTNIALGTCLPGLLLTGEGAESVISSPTGFVTWHLNIRLDAMFQATELSADNANLDTSLANMDGDAFMYGCYFAAAKQMAERKRKGCCFLPQGTILRWLI